MNQITEAIVAVVVLVVMFFLGFAAGVSHVETKQMKTQQKQIVAKEKLATQITNQDQKIQAEADAKEVQQTKVIIQKEVVYRDRIKNPDVRKCVSDSGLLGLYDSTVSDTTK